MSKEQEYKKIIGDNLDNVLASGFIPELGEHRKGKVRDNHFSGDKVIMVASDRVSCFDIVLSRLIPYKGVVLNLFNQWAMENTVGIFPNAMLESPDPNVIVQKRGENAGFEFIVRGYVWGSLASDYEQGKREKSGIILPNDLLRYQKLDAPLFTPTTKAEGGKHDEDITIDDIAQKLGKDDAHGLKVASLRLYSRGAKLASAAGMRFLDTKYEFAKVNGMWLLIDESTTPDSSRFCSEEEYDNKWPQIQALMEGGKFETVSKLLEDRPDLKIREESKQYTRDVLIEAGYKGGDTLPEISDENVIETAWRYIDSYEKLTGQEFDFAESELSTRKRVMNNLVKAGLAYGGCVVPMGASVKDKGHWEKIQASLVEAGIPHTEPFYASAHKQTQTVLDHIKKMDTSIEPIVYLTFAGRSNGLSPVVAGNTHNPVIACCPYSDTATMQMDVWSSLRMPSQLPLAVIIEPGNAALYAKRIIDLAK